METLLAEEEEWASGAMPVPASLEYTPRARPQRTGNGRRLRHQTQDSVGLLRRRGVWRNAGGPGERMCWRP